MEKPLLRLAALSARWLPQPVKRLVYAFKPLAAFIRKSLNKAAPQGLSLVQVAAGDLAGVSLYLDLQTEKDYWLGTYEPDLQAAIRDLVKTGMVAYDVGANIGYISLLLARQVKEKGRVFAFEALPANQERLSKNLEASGLGDWVQLYPGAVMDKTQPVQFFIGPSGGMGKVQGSAGRQEMAYPEAIQVQGIALDEFVFDFGNPAPQVVKMDIEGGEILALPGMSRLLKDARPVLMLELHGPEAARVCWQLLKAAHYRVCRMQPGYPRVAAVEDLDWKAYLVAFPEE